MTRIQSRRDTAANWLSVNPILALGEIGIEIDTHKMKTGDGSLTWNDLPYMTGPVDGSNVSLQVARDTTANLTALTDPFLSGQIVYNTDTGAIKIGDGETQWKDLPYIGFPNFYDSVIVYSEKSVIKNTTESSIAQDLRNVSYVNIYIKNSVSTNLTVNVYSSLDQLGSIKTLIGTTTLNATTITQDEITISKCPNYLFFDVINADITNDAIVDVLIQRTVSSNNLIPYSNVIPIYSEQVVAANTTLTPSAQDIRGTSYVYPFVKNSGSTNLIVNIYGSPDQLGSIKTLVKKYELNITTTQAGDPIEKCPNYLFFELVNGDLANAATVDISIQRS